MKKLILPFICLFAFFSFSCCVSANQTTDQVLKSTRGNECVIVDHVVYELIDSKSGKYYNVCSMYDSKESYDALTNIVIPEKINGITVKSISTINYEDHDDYKTYTPLYPVYYKSDGATPTEISYGSKALKKVVLPESVTSIGHSAFYGCENLKSINLSNVKTIEAEAFKSCVKLDNIKLCKNVKIGTYAFWGSGISELEFPEGIKEIPAGVLYDCKNLKTVTIPEGTSTINRYAFCKSGLTTINIPESVKEIGDFAFSSCKIKSLNIPANCYVSRYAINNCSKLEKLVYSGKGDISIFADSFNGCNNLKTVYITKGSGTLTVNKSAKVKSSFSNCKLLEKLVVYSKNVKNWSFVNDLPKTCNIVVKNPDHVKRIKENDFKGTVKLKITVSTPENLKATKSEKKIKLKWSEVEKATGYRIYLYDKQTNTYTAVKTVKGATSATLNLSKKGTYNYSIRAFRKIDGVNYWSGYSELLKVKVK